MRAPKSGKKYAEIVKRGCGGYYDSRTSDYACEHEYEWECDHCPCLIENQKVRHIVNSTEEVALNLGMVLDRRG